MHLERNTRDNYIFLFKIESKTIYKEISTLMQDNDSHILHQRRRRGGQGASSKHRQIA
jgi:hypothetical protein